MGKEGFYDVLTVVVILIGIFLLDWSQKRMAALSQQKPAAPPPPTGVAVKKANSSDVCMARIPTAFMLRRSMLPTERRYALVMSLLENAVSYHDVMVSMGVAPVSLTDASRTELQFFTRMYWLVVGAVQDTAAGGTAAELKIAHMLMTAVHKRYVAPDQLAVAIAVVVEYLCNVCEDFEPVRPIIAEIESFEQQRIVRQVQLLHADLIAGGVSPPSGAPSPSPSATTHDAGSGTAAAGGAGGDQPGGPAKRKAAKTWWPFAGLGATKKAAEEGEESDESSSSCIDTEDEVIPLTQQRCIPRVLVPETDDDEPEEEENDATSTVSSSLVLSSTTEATTVRAFTSV